MSSSSPEIKWVVYLTLIGYAINLVSGNLGASLFPDNSYLQLLTYQISDTGAIVASLLASRYVGLKGHHMAATAFTLMGITHGISLAASGLDQINVEKGIGVVMPMIPAFLLMIRFTMIPLWLRLAGLLPALIFAVNYVFIMQGGDYFSWYTYVGYGAWMLVELGWAIYIYKDWKKT